MFIRSGVSIYAGCKITVLKNYNAPIRQAFKHIVCQSDPVSNGELFVVVRAERYQRPGRGVRLTCRDTLDEDGVERILWVDAKAGIHPGHIDHGYAVTTYKSQGARARSRAVESSLRQLPLRARVPQRHLFEPL